MRPRAAAERQPQPGTRGPARNPGWGSRLPVAEARVGGGGGQDRGNSSRRAAPHAQPHTRSLRRATSRNRPCSDCKWHLAPGFNGLGRCIDWWNFGTGTCESQWEARQGGAGEPEGLQVPACKCRSFCIPRTLQLGFSRGSPA